MTKKLTKKQKEAITGYLFFMPALINLVFLLGIPILYALYISFTDYNLYNDLNFVGFQNYRNLFNDRLFYKSLENTLFHVIFSIPVNTTIGVSLALLLNNQQLKGLKIFRTTFLLPTVVSGVAVTLLWQWILDPNFGLINSFLMNFGINGPGWLTDSAWSKPSIVLMNAWSVGGTMMIYLAGLQGIPKTLYDSATIDGAGSLRRFWHVTVPMLSPTIFFNMITGAIGAFQVFTEAYIMTGGGPNNSTLYYAYHLYNKAFSDLQLGYASAMGWILMLITLVLTLIAIRISSRYVHYEGGQRN